MRDVPDRFCPGLRGDRRGNALEILCCCESGRKPDRKGVPQRRGPSNLKRIIYLAHEQGALP